MGKTLFLMFISLWAVSSQAYSVESEPGAISQSGAVTKTATNDYFDCYMRFKALLAERPDRPGWTIPQGLVEHRYVKRACGNGPALSSLNPLLKMMRSKGLVRLDIELEKIIGLNDYEDIFSYLMREYRGLSAAAARELSTNLRRIREALDSNSSNFRLSAKESRQSAVQ